MKTKLLVLVLPIALAACLFPMSTREAEEANSRHVQRMCNDSNYAYESGYNAGLERKRLDTTWVDTGCMGSAQAQHTRASYQSGYQSGVQHAPIVVRGTGTSAAPAGGTSTSECTFSSDCGADRSCRADAAGVKVCMGGGYAGDACWFSSDCLSDSCDGSSKTCR